MELSDGETYNPFVIPEVPYEEDGVLYVKVGQGQFGDYYGDNDFDGRVVLLGEFITKDGEYLDIQLKGSGKTPYSRGGDGKAALGPMLREYIISEAMKALNIPTTRSLAVLTTGEDVFRENVL